MNNGVNTLFRSYNDLDLVERENIVLEAETKLNDKERRILSHIYSIFKQSEFQNKHIVCSFEDISEEDLMNLQQKRVLLINIDRKEYMLTQWYKMRSQKGTNSVVLELDDMICEYFKLFPSSYLN
ncbi:hypothetical protein [Intestinibacter bartlettii]|uniref:Uncharacterized protein n=1 Tax=Intestinibacter bartlettii TaxID=261299 RepID=A0ABS6DWY7_9FIRM|nr:hypothetical protein [Intestinibacter bartlettii]MBU5336260.1 hypothetical protein [Intestinibacter bartlettii]